MAFKKGNKLGKGRPKGSVNRNALNIREKLAEAGFDTVTELIGLYKRTENDVVQAKILVHFNEYMYPKLSAIELSGEVNNPFKAMTLEELRAVAREKGLIK